MDLPYPYHARQWTGIQRAHAADRVLRRTGCSVARLGWVRDSRDCQAIPGEETAQVSCDARACAIAGWEAAEPGAHQPAGERSQR
jgi:hypothetical protein